MQRILGSWLALLVVCVSTMAMAGEIESGLQPGDDARAFNVKDVTGPKQGESLCYR